MKAGDWAYGAPSKEESPFWNDYPVVVGKYVPLGFSILGTTISLDGIEVVDEGGVPSVVVVEAASPAHARRKQTVVK